MMQFIPSDLLVNIISYTEKTSVKDLSLVSKQWEQATKLALTSLFNTYKDEPQLRGYVDSSIQALSLEAADEEKIERVKLIFHAVMQEARGLNIISKFPSPSMDSLVVENLKHVAMQIDLIKQAEQLNLFFIRLSETLPAAKTFLDQLSSIEDCPLDRAQQIREWMADNTASLVQVTVLYLTNLNLKILPKEIGFFTQLQELWLYNNQLQKLPAEIGCLTQLQTLDLNKNQLRELPFEIGNLTQLQTLDLSKNQFQELPAQIGKLIQLQALNLTNNQLKELPEEIGNFTQLQSLNLSNNQLKKLPLQIRNLAQLQILDLTNNQLEELPAEIGDLTQLQALNLINNQLQKLSAEIGNLTQLQALNLNNNPLQKLPNELEQLTNKVIQQALQNYLLEL